MLEPGVSIAPLVDAAECYQLVKEIFGLEARQVTELNGYDDKNFKVVVGPADADARAQLFVLKILNSLDSKKLAFIEAQNAMLLHLGARGVVCPQPRPTISGRYYTVRRLKSGEHVVRLMKFIEGMILPEVDGTWDLYHRAGEYVAMIDNYLEDFSHEAYDTHTSLWMLDSVPQLRQFLRTVPDASRREKFDEVIATFERDVKRIVEDLPRGMIHGDFNEQNVVVQSKDGAFEIAGILDFGDSQKGCYIYELAIAMTYMMIVSKNMAIGGAVLQGYLKQRKMSDKELGLLRICILARISQSLVMGAYSAHLHPENATYLLTTSIPGWTLFEELYKHTNEELLSIWHESPK